MLMDESERLNASNKKYRSLHKDITKIISSIDKTPNSEWAVLNSNLSQLQKLIHSASAKVVNEPVIFADTNDARGKVKSSSSSAAKGSGDSGGGGGLMSRLGGSKQRTAQQKHLQAMAEQHWAADEVNNSDLLTDFPGKSQLFSVLVKCMDPSIAMGVHKKAVETLSVVCSRLNPSLLCEYLPLFTLPLFCLLQASANQVRPDILNLIEDFLVPLPLEGLRSGGLSGIISAVLPSLMEKDLAAKAKHILDLLRERFETLDGTVLPPSVSAALPKSSHLSALSLHAAQQVAPQQREGQPQQREYPPSFQCSFYRSLWSILRNSPDARTPGLKYIRDILPKAVAGVSTPIDPEEPHAAGFKTSPDQTLRSTTTELRTKQSVIPLAMLGGEEPAEEGEVDVDGAPKREEWGCNSRAGNFIEVVVDAISLSLMDKQEVQRQALDLLVYHFPLCEEGILSFGHKVLLVRSVLRILVSNQNATLRRVFMWLYGGDTIDEGYFRAISCDLVVAALTEMMDDSTDAAIRVRHSSHLASQAAAAALLVGNFAGTALSKGRGQRSGGRREGGPLDAFAIESATNTLLGLIDDSFGSTLGAGGASGFNGDIGTGVLVRTHLPSSQQSTSSVAAGSKTGGALVSEDGLTTSTFTSTLVFEVLVALLSRPSEEEAFLSCVLPPLVPSVCRFFNVYSMATLSSASSGGAPSSASSPSSPNDNRSVKFIGAAGATGANKSSAHTDRADSLLTSVDARLNDVMDSAVQHIHTAVSWSHFLRHVCVEQLGPLLGDSPAARALQGLEDSFNGRSKADCAYLPFMVGYEWGPSADGNNDRSASAAGSLLGDTQTLLHTLRAVHVVSEGTRPAYLSHMTSMSADYLDPIAHLAAAAKGLLTDIPAATLAMSKEVRRFQHERDQCLVIVFTICRQLCRIMARLLHDATAASKASAADEGAQPDSTDYLLALRPFAAFVGGGDGVGGRSSNLPRAVLEVFQGFYFGVAQGLLTTKAMEDQAIQQLERKLMATEEVVSSSTSRVARDAFCPSVKDMTAALNEDLLEVFKEASSVALSFFPEGANVGDATREKSQYESMIYRCRPGYVSPATSSVPGSSRGTPRVASPPAASSQMLDDATNPMFPASGNRSRSQSLSVLGRQATRAERDERQASVLPTQLPHTEGLTNFVSELCDTVYSVYSHLQKEARSTPDANVTSSTRSEITGFVVDTRPAASAMPWWLQRTLLLIHVVDPALAVCAAQLYLDVLLGELSLLSPDAFPSPKIVVPTIPFGGGSSPQATTAAADLCATLEGAANLVLGRLWPLMAATQSAHHVQVTKLLVRSYAAHPYLRHVLDDLMTRADSANIRYFSSLFHVVTECKRSGLGNAANDPSLFYPGLKGVLRLRLDAPALRAVSIETCSLGVHPRQVASLRRNSSAVFSVVGGAASASFGNTAVLSGGTAVQGGDGTHALLLRAFIEQSLPYFRRVIDPLLFELLTVDFRDGIPASPYTPTSRLLQLQRHRALIAAGAVGGVEVASEEDEGGFYEEQTDDDTPEAQDARWLANFCCKAQEFVDLISELVDVSGASVVASLLAMPSPSFARYIIGKASIPVVTPTTASFTGEAQPDTASPSDAPPNAASPREVYLLPVNQAVRYGVDEDVPRHSTYGLIIYILLRLVRKCANDSMQPLYTDRSGQYDDKALLGQEGVPAIEEGFESELSATSVALLNKLITIGCEVAETLSEEEMFGAETAVGGLGTTSSIMSSSFSPARPNTRGSAMSPNGVDSASEGAEGGMSLYCSPSAVVTLVANCCTHVGAALGDLLKIAVAIRLPSSQVVLLDTLHATQQFLDAVPKGLLLVAPVRTTLTTTAFTPPASMGLNNAPLSASTSGPKSAMKRARVATSSFSGGTPVSTGGGGGQQDVADPFVIPPNAVLPAAGQATSDVLVLRFTERPSLFQTPGFITTLKSGLLAAGVAELHPVLCSYGLLNKWRSITTRILPLLHGGLPTATHELMHTYCYVITIVKRRQLSPLTATVMRQCLEGLVDLFNFVYVGAGRNFSSSETTAGGPQGGGGRNGGANNDFFLTSWLGGGSSAAQGSTTKSTSTGLFKRSINVSKTEAAEHAKQAQSEIEAFLETLVATLTDVFVTTHQSIERAMLVSHRDAQTSLRITQTTLAQQFQLVLAALVRYAPSELFDRVVWLWMRRNINVVGSSVLASSPVYAAAAAFVIGSTRQQQTGPETVDVSQQQGNNALRAGESSTTKYRSNTLVAIGDNCTDFWSPSSNGEGMDQFGGTYGEGGIGEEIDRSGGGGGLSRSALTDSLISLLVALFTPHQVVEMSSQLLTKLRAGLIKGGAPLGNSAADAVVAALSGGANPGSSAVQQIYHRALSAFAQLELSYDAALFHFTASYFQAAPNPDQWIVQGLLLDMVQQQLASAASCSILAVPFALNLLEVVHARHVAVSGLGRGAGDVYKDKRMCAIALRACEIIFPSALSDTDITSNGIVALRLLSKYLDDLIPKALQADSDWNTATQTGAQHLQGGGNRGGSGSPLSYSMGHRELSPHEVKSVDALCNLTQRYLIPSLKQAMDGKDAEAVVALSTRSEVVLEVLGKILRLAEYPQKKLRYDLLDLFFSEPFFRMSRGALTKWRDVLGLLTLDRTLNTVVAQRVSSKGTNMFTSIVTSVDEEATNRAKVLKRLAFYVLSTNTLDPVFVSLLKEKLVDTFRSFQGAAQVAVRHALLVFRILLLRLQPAVISGFWPVVLPEMLRILASYRMASDAPICVEVLKIVDLAIVLLPSEFQVFRWAFLDDDQNVSSEAVRLRNVGRRSKYAPAALYQSSKSNSALTNSVNQARATAQAKRTQVNAATVVPSGSSLGEACVFVPLLRGLHKSTPDSINMAAIRREAVPASALLTPDAISLTASSSGKAGEGPRPYTHLNRPLLAYPERCYLDLKGIDVLCCAFTALGESTSSEGTFVALGGGVGGDRRVASTSISNEGFIDVASAAVAAPSREGSSHLVGDLATQGSVSSVPFVPKDGDVPDRQYVQWLLEAEFVHVLGDAGEQFHALRRHAQQRGTSAPTNRTTLPISAASQRVRRAASSRNGVTAPDHIPTQQQVQSSAPTAGGDVSSQPTSQRPVKDVEEEEEEDCREAGLQQSPQGAATDNNGDESASHAEEEGNEDIHHHEGESNQEADEGESSTSSSTSSSSTDTEEEEPCGAGNAVMGGEGTADGRGSTQSYDEEEVAELAPAPTAVAVDGEEDEVVPDDGEKTPPHPSGNPHNALEDTEVEGGFERKTFH